MDGQRLTVRQAPAGVRRPGRLEIDNGQEPDDGADERVGFASELGDDHVDLLVHRLEG